MKIMTTRFGEIEIEENKIITVSKGLVGFPQRTKYIILDHPNKKSIPFKWFQSADEPSLALVIIDPLLFKPDYKINYKLPEITSLGSSNPKDFLALVIVSILKDPQEITANLLSPIIININTKIAKQIILYESKYDIRHSFVIKKEVPQKTLSL